jgi:hypothetical protein
MNNRELMVRSLGHALAVFFYVAGVAGFMFNGERFFGHVQSFIVPLTILLLFVLSAAITGTLVLGRPILLYMEGKKSDAFKFFGLTVLWISLITVLVLVSHLLG